MFQRVSQNYHIIEKAFVTRSLYFFLMFHLRSTQGVMRELSIVTDYFRASATHIILDLKPTRYNI